MKIKIIDNRVFALQYRCIQISLKFPYFQVSEKFRILGGIRICGGKFPRSNFPKKLAETEAELVALSDASNQVLWTRNFLERQGHPQPPALIYQDSQSTIQLMRNGRSNSERTHHVDIRYFFQHDRISTGDIDIVYLPTTDMIADILTKPLQGKLFKKLRKELLNTTPPTLTYAEDCKTEDRTDSAPTSVRTKSNPRFPNTQELTPTDEDSI